ncbi:MAG: phosphatase PAP2 family protein [Chitinophagales bacterium]|nr:phosphatase PAP2 family protein [Chitinophagales bacterium]MDW8393205.1 phosphatase PAP2 family protein [Chitinophagales bacterium]
METVLHWDYRLFFFINRTLSNPLFDWFLPLARDKYFWIPLYAGLLVYLFFRFRRQLLIVLPALALTITLTDQLTASVIKPWFGRLRPCRHPDIGESVRLLVDCGPAFSFVSAHAANAFGAAVFFIVVLHPAPNWLVVLAVLWAVSIALAQVYVGVHFPADVLGGALLGWLAGQCTGRMARWALKRFPK